MLKRECGAERNGKLPHLSIPSKTAILVPEFAVEDLPSGRSAALVPDFAVNPWAEHSDDTIKFLRKSALHKHYFNIGKIGWSGALQALIKYLRNCHLCT